MRRRIFLIVSLIVLAATAAVVSKNVTIAKLPANTQAAKKRDAPRPKLEIAESLTYDFGKLPQMRASADPWEVTNAGDGDLELWLEDATVSATLSLPLPPEEQKSVLRIKPAQTATIEFHWNTKRFINQYSQACTIGTNDPHRPIVKLAVRGHVFAAKSGSN